jgi:aquaporin Z
MKDSLRHFIAEFVGTFALVFVGGGTIIGVAATGTEAALVTVALAHGVVLAVFVSALMRISGHFNPAVTLGFLAARRIEAMMAGVYIAAQVIGAIIAAYALQALFPDGPATATRLGGQAITLDITAGQAIVMEAIATFFLTFVIFGTAVDPKAPRIGGLAIGLTLTVCILATGPFTGGSLNPARSLGPAVASGVFEGLYVYFVGPIIGAIAAALLYDGLFIRRDREPVDHGAVRP